jgi:NTP pyrophosphatase (non-canonical NTP hydrolase)
MTEETTVNVVTFEDYENFVTNLASKDSMKDFNAKLGTAGLGLAGEAGEISQLTFGVLEDYTPWSREISEKYVKELGDVMWYTAFMARNVLDIGLKDLAELPPAEILAGDPD